MIKKIYSRIKNILISDPNLLFSEDRSLINKAFYFQGNNGKAILLIHGWTSTAYEVRRLGQFLNSAGYTASGPILSGHGTTHSDLENIKIEDWLADIERNFLALKKEHQQVYIIGTSIGSNLAAVFSAGRTDVVGLVLLATPYRMKLEILTIQLAKFMNIFMTYKKKFYPPTFGLSTTITRLISYQTYPIKSALETFRIIEKSRGAFEEIVQPCLMMQSTHDHVIAKNSLEEIYKRIKSSAKKKRYVRQAYHTFISDVKNDYVFKDILEFLNKH
jgi:carboxylesterase